MKIDAHVHFWGAKFPEKVWIRKKIAALQRDFAPDDLRPLMRETGVEGVVLVQAAPDYQETDYFLKIGASESFVLGVVGWVNLEEDEDTLEASLERYGKNSKFKGVRNHPPREFDAKWLRDSKVKRGYRKLIERSFPCDLMVTCRQLQETRQLLMELGDLTAIINHGGRPFVMTGEVEPWASEMRAIARDTNAYCKLSGLVERAGQEWTMESVRPWVEILLEAFGPNRLMFASNWPVMTIMATYAGWWETLSNVLDGIGASAQDRDALLGATAAKAYRL
jgi:L-fuconolactonase